MSRRLRTLDLPWPSIVAWIVLPIAIAALAWQPSNYPLAPAPGLDLSWTAGLSMATHGGIDFGNRVIFTYGPLGFLLEPTTWFGGLGALSLSYLLIMRLALAIALYVGARQTFGAIAAFLVAIVVSTSTTEAPESIIAVVALVLALSSELRRRSAILISAAAGAFAAFELLAKVSIGIALVVVTAIFVLSLAGWRRESAIAGVSGFLVTLLAGWLVSGQDLSALPDYAKNSFQIVSGYAPAMSISTGTLSWQGSAAIVAVCLGLWAAMHSTTRADGRQRAGVIGLWLATCFFAFKEGFVRHEAFHGALFFQTVLGGFVAFGWRASHRLAALACLAALVSLTLAAQSLSLTSKLHLVRNVRAAVNDVRDIASPGRRDALITAGRAAIEQAEPLDPQSLALVRGQTVATYPYEIALAWAYRLNWDPIPVLQSYSAYTTELDDVDARFLESSSGPDRILMQEASPVDNRILSFDQGRTNRTILCRYLLLRLTPPHAVLGRAPSRCTGETLLQTVHADWGTSVSVPPLPNNHSLVFVRISGVDIGGLERIRALLFKPQERFIILNGNSFRLVPGTAADGLPLDASRGFDYPPPFNLAPGAKTIAVVKLGSGPTGGKPIAFSFYAEEFDGGAGKAS